MTTVIVILLILIILYLMALMGRSGRPEWEELKKWAYAHRGFHGNGVPENSMEAFRLALEKGYGIELDLHLLADGKLAVIHDSALKRTTGADGRVEDLTADQLADYWLEGTAETIPEFSQVLELFAGKAPMIVELKAEQGNHAPLCEAVCKALEHYDGPYCIESFDPRCIQWLRENRPEIIRGQLTENFLKDKNSGLSLPTRLVLTLLVLNCKTRPDFIACRFEDRKGLSPALCQELWGIQSVSWTLRNKADYDKAVSEGRIPIFEYFEP